MRDTHRWSCLGWAHRSFRRNSRQSLSYIRYLRLEIGICVLPEIDERCVVCSGACTITLSLVQLAQPSLYQGQIHHVVGEPVDGLAMQVLLEHRYGGIWHVCLVERAARVVQDSRGIFVYRPIGKAICLPEFGGCVARSILRESNLGLDPMGVRLTVTPRYRVRNLRDLSKHCACAICASQRSVRDAKVAVWTVQLG